MRATTRVLAAALAILLFATGPALAQEEHHHGEPATQKAAGDSIKVHGHWTIDVKNAEGSVVSHNEFENALVYSGAFTLTSLLTNPAFDRVGGWVVVISGCCIIAEAGVPQILLLSEPPQSTNLTATQQSDGVSLLLQGSVQAASPVSISHVETQLIMTNPDASSATYGAFTERDLKSTITVQAGQTIQVTVVISFS